MQACHYHDNLNILYLMREFIAGIKSYEEALRVVSSYRLWGFVLLPGLLSIVIGVTIVILAFSIFDNIGGWLSGFWPWAWGASTVNSIADIFGGLLVIIIGLLLFKQLVMVVTAPFLSILSEKVENRVFGIGDGVQLSTSRVVREILRGLAIAIRNLLREISYTVILLLLGLIPLFTPFIAIAIFILQAYYAGFGNMDFALERYMGYRESIRFVRNHRMLALGNGVVFLLLLFTFIGFLVAMPLGTVAATIETGKRLHT